MGVAALAAGPASLAAAIAAGPSRDLLVLPNGSRNSTFVSAPALRAYSTSAVPATVRLGALSKGSRARSLRGGHIARSMPCLGARLLAITAAARRVCRRAGHVKDVSALQDARK